MLRNGYRARKPTGLFWLRLGEVPLDAKNTAVGWLHEKSNTSVLSSLVALRLPRSGRTGPQWQISIASRTRDDIERPSKAQMRLARCAFDMMTAEEDNHSPGHTRHLFLPVDPSERIDCECKTNEAIVTEPDGFAWSNPVEGECRGCRFQRQMGELGIRRTCPIHDTKTATALPHGEAR